MESSAFAPAHLTGFFKIFKNGSGGAGLTLQHGMHTKVEKAQSAKSSIRINGARSPAPVSSWVLGKFLPHLDFPVCVSHASPLPIGCGLGMSAAGAFSLSLALNHLAGSPYGYASCMKFAHDAEIACGTGLSSVDVQAIGGMVSRKGGSGPPHVKKLSKQELASPCRLFVFGPIRTSSIIRSNSWKEKANAASDECMRVFSKGNDICSLALASNIFALKSGLGNWAFPILSSHPYVGMAMLGKTLFDPKLSLLRAPAIGGIMPKAFTTYPTNMKAHLC